MKFKSVRITVISLFLLGLVETPVLGQQDPSALEGEGSANAEEEEIDLDQLEEEEPAPPPTGHPGGSVDSGRLIPFKFKLFFDLLLEYEWEREILQFTRDHNYVVLELSATEWLSFRTDVSLMPQFYEIVFHIGQNMELRLGRVLIPFGQNEFHHLIGGRVDEQNLFLPAIWADNGVAFKHIVYDGELISFDYSAWVVNGFNETIDPVSGTPFPSRVVGEGLPPGDNNVMKGLGVRPTVRFGPAITIGTSWYLDIWNDYNAPLETPAPSEVPSEAVQPTSIDKQMMLFYGADVDFGYGFIPVDGLRDIRIRGEIAWGEVMLPQSNWYRGLFFYYASLRRGFNLELSYRIFNFLILRYRFGYLDADHRNKDVNDLFIHEPGLIASFGPLKFSLLVQLHDIIATPPYPTEPEDYSRLYFRVLFRY